MELQIFSRKLKEKRINERKQANNHLTIYRPLFIADNL
jgi:hypothetical protein